MKKYDISISFADEQQLPYVDSFYKKLKNKKSFCRNIYYYTEMANGNAGINLRAELTDVFQNRSKLVVVFLSHDYFNSNKIWTWLEWKAILNKALLLNETHGNNQPYLIPVLFDSITVDEVISYTTDSKQKIHNLVDALNSLKQEQELGEKIREIFESTYGQLQHSKELTILIEEIQTLIQKSEEVDSLKDTLDKYFLSEGNISKIQDFLFNIGYDEYYEPLEEYNSNLVSKVFNIINGNEKFWEKYICFWKASALLFILTLLFLLYPRGGSPKPCSLSITEVNHRPITGDRQLVSENFVLNTDVMCSLKSHIFLSTVCRPSTNKDSLWLLVQSQKIQYDGVHSNNIQLPVIDSSQSKSYEVQTIISETVLPKRMSSVFIDTLFGIGARSQIIDVVVPQLEITTISSITNPTHKVESDNIKVSVSGKAQYLNGHIVKFKVASIQDNNFLLNKRLRCKIQNDYWSMNIPVREACQYQDYHFMLKAVSNVGFDIESEIWQVSIPSISLEIKGVNGEIFNRNSLPLIPTNSILSVNGDAINFLPNDKIYMRVFVLDKQGNELYSDDSFGNITSSGNWNLKIPIINGDSIKCYILPACNKPNVGRLKREGHLIQFLTTNTLSL